MSKKLKKLNNEGYLVTVVDNFTPFFYVECDKNYVDIFLKKRKNFDLTVMDYLRDKQIKFFGKIFWAIQGEFKNDREREKIFKIKKNGSDLLIAIEYHKIKGEENVGECLNPEVKILFKRKIMLDSSLGNTFFVIEKK